MFFKYWLDGFLSRSFRASSVQSLRSAVKTRRSSRLARSGEPLEVRELLTANLQDLLLNSQGGVTLTTRSDVGQDPWGDAIENGKEFTPAVPPTDVAGSFLTVSGSNDTKALSFNDISQGSTDDCVFMASLSAVARTQANLSANISVSSQNGNTTTYAVKLYREVTSGGSTSYPYSYVLVNFDGVRASGDSQLGDNGEFWPIIYERAYLQFTSFQGLDYHSYQVALTALTGEAATKNNVTSALATAQLLKSNLDHGLVEVTGSYDSVAELVNPQYGIVGNHAYSVVGVEIPANGDLSKTYVTLRNPWGVDTDYSYYDTNHDGDISSDELVKSFSGMDGADDGLIRIPWSAYTASFKSFSFSGDSGPSINNPQPPQAQFAQASYGPFTIYEGQPLTINFKATDPAGGTVLYSVDGLDQPGNIHPQTGQFTWTPMNGDYGDQYFEVEASAGPYTTATMGFLVHVLQGSPVVNSFTVAPTTLHDDGSDLFTLKANVTVPYGSIYDVSFYSDANNNGTFEPGADPLLGGGQKSGNDYSWSGYAGMAVGTHNFFVVATRYDHDVFKGYGITSATVVAAPHADPIAIPAGNETLFTTAGVSEVVLRSLSDAAGNLYTLVADQTPNSSSTHAVGVAKFDSTGHFITGFQVAENTTGYLADMVVLADGSVGVAWQEYNTPSYGSSNLLVRWYNSTGTPTSTTKTLVTGSAWAQNTTIRAAADAAGNMLIAYTVGEYFSEDVKALSVARNGTITRAPWTVNSHTANTQTTPVVALNANGDGVILWADIDQSILMARQVSSAGVNNGPEFNVITTSNNLWDGYAAAVNPNGEFYLSWVNSGIYLQKYSSAGQPVGTALKVNTFNGGTVVGPTLALSTSGWMAVGWENSLQDGNDTGVFQVLDPSGAKIGPEVIASNSPSLEQGSPLMVMDPDGDIAAFYGQEVGSTSYQPTLDYVRFFNVDLPPTFDPVSPFYIHENSPGGTVIGTVHATDADPGSSIVYSLQSSDIFQINASTGQLSVSPGAVLDYEMNPFYAIPVRATSGSKSATIYVEINLTDVNEAPKLDTLQSSYTYSTRALPIVFTDAVFVDDVDTPAFIGGSITATITSNGTVDDRLSVSAYNFPFTVSASSDLLLNDVVIGTVVSNGQGLTPLKINLNANATLDNVSLLLRNLQFSVDSDTPSLLTRTITLSVNDGQLTSNSVTRDVAVTGNNAPLLNNAGNPVLDSIPEDVVTANNPGTLIRSLIASMGPGGGISDPDQGAAQGIAITVADQTHGTWQFTTDGTTWTAFGTLSITNALQLASDAKTRVRFLPAADYNGIATFTYVAWDRTAGTNGTTASAASRGANKPFSLGYDTAVLTVTNTNDAPVLNNAGSPTLPSIAEDISSASNTGTLISAVIASMSPLGSITDIDPAAKRGIAITVADQTHGTWQFTTDGTTWTNFGTLSVGNALQLASDAKTKIRFVPNLNYNGISTFTYVAWDQNEGVNGTTASATARGLARPFSNGYDTAVITVTPLNDAPVLNNAGSPVLPSIAEDVAVAGNAGSLVSSLIASMSPLGSITDVDVAAKQGIAITVADQTHGTWQFTTDGTTWTNFGTLSITNSLLLASDAKTKVRFLPNADYNGIATFTYVAWDQTTGTNGTTTSASARGFATPFSLGYDTAVVTITPVNDAPVLNAAGAPTLPTITEDLSLANNSGTLITSLIASMSPLGSITDVDAAAKRGIAISVADQTHGVWQFTTDGTTWTPFGAVSASAALQLAADAKTKIRFVANANYNGISTFTFVAWDQTTGTNGTSASITTRGGTKAFSTGYDTAVITVTAVNDAPVLVADGNPVLTSIAKNIADASNTGTLVSSIIASMAPNGSITDVDAGAKQGIAIIGANQVSGKWQFTLDGTTWADFGTIAATNTLLLASDAKTKIRFVPNANYTGTVGFTFAAWDQTSGGNGSFISLSSSGGATAFSAVRDNAFISVT